MSLNLTLILLALLLIVSDIRAEDGLAGWLRYALPPNAQQLQRHIPTKIAILNGTVTSPVFSAGTELKQGVNSILSTNVVTTTSRSANTNVIVVGFGSLY